MDHDWLRASAHPLLSVALHYGMCLLARAVVK